ncbi:MAG: DNA starvation/stationary phase protection protein [Chloroflexi bacterium]|nr:MAG: DNA starvation/stationary phase protection protein [Chloroflexota bacterium]
MATKKQQAKTQLIPPNIAIPDANRKVITDTLQAILADAHLLTMKSRKFHWNVQGPRFHMLHELFQEQYTLIEGAIDEIAERIQMLGFMANGTLAEMLKNTQLKEQPGVNPPAQQMVAELLADHETIIRALREAADLAEEKEDMGTNDFLIGLMQAHEKMAWMLRATCNEFEEKA